MHEKCLGNADKKPWHPLNFRNQMKRFEAEEELIRRQKLEEANKAEFDAEQTYLETLAYLPGLSLIHI